MTVRVLVVGAGGAFGRRLVEGLLATTDLGVVLAGRDAGRAERLAAGWRGRFPERALEAVALDRDRATAADIRRSEAGIVIDAAGPFQGAEPTLARAAIRAGAAYLDLADGRAFVADFPALDAGARAAGVLAVTGASSTPALSHAVLDALTAGWSRVEAVEIAISPGNRAPRGAAVVEAILSYAGRPVRVWTEGRWQARAGWGGLVRRHLPGLGTRWLSLCETPDLDLVPQRFSTVRTALFQAGLELGVLHLGLWLLTWPVRLKLLPNLRPLARPLHRLACLFERFGSDRGGMTVEAAGLDAQGRPVRALWSLVAEAGDGPNIPVLPALALVRARAAGRLSGTGARPAAGLLPLEAIEAEFARFAIRTRTWTSRLAAGPLLERALGPAFEDLPEPVRRTHQPAPALRAVGEVAIEGPGSLIGRLVAGPFGFPARSQDGVPATVELAAREDGSEVWTRRFGGARFRSRLSLGPRPGLLVERFGPFRFLLLVEADATGFSLSVEGWSVGPLPLPRRLAPRSDARAAVDEAGRYRFDVAVDLPLVGRLVRYRGVLEAEAPSGGSPASGSRAATPVG